MLKTPHNCHYSSNPFWRGLWRPVALTGALLGSWGMMGNPVQAQTATPLPNTVQTLIRQMDQAASQENLDGVMNGVSRTFRHADGLTYDTLAAALEAFWSRYDNLSYSTTVNSWEQDGSAIVVQTTTQITGTQDLEGRVLALEATLTSEQRYEGGQLVAQETLTETSQVTAGENPPVVAVNLPEAVSIGQSFYFDAIVNEPLGDRRLLGAALEETANAQGYLATAPLDLQLLSAGGLFKVGRASALPEQRWISGVLIHEDGITMITRRIRFENR